MNILHDNNNGLDVEKIMEEIRDNIKKRYPDSKDMYREFLTSAFDQSGNDLRLDSQSIFSNLHANIDYNNANWRTYSELPLSNKVTKIKDFTKRVIRKMIKWYTYPSLYNQNELNGSFTRSFNEMLTIIRHQAQRIENLERRIKDTSVNTFDFNYKKFEEEYRGTEDKIKEHMKYYLPFFADKNNILDIGCGRGEFLSLLTEKGILCKGIDLSSDMIQTCRNKGLNVSEADALDYLEQLEDSTLGGILIAQVVEHLTPKELIKLIELCERKLQPGGVLAIETINPQCLGVFGRSFYMDLTHHKPVHPLLLDFLLRDKRFNNVDIKFLSPLPEEFKLPPIPNNENNDQISKFNGSLKLVNELLFGYQDYAIIANKNGGGLNEN